MSFPMSVIEQLKDALGCFCNKSAVRVVLYDGCEPADLTNLGGGGGGSPFGASDLEVVCDAEGNQMFVKVIAAEEGCEYVNPATGDTILPMVDFFPCPPPDNSALIDAIQELTECMCAPCPDGVP